MYISRLLGSKEVKSTLDLAFPSLSDSLTTLELLPELSWRNPVKLHSPKSLWSKGFRSVEYGIKDHLHSGILPSPASPLTFRFLYQGSPFFIPNIKYKGKRMSYKAVVSRDHWQRILLQKRNKGNWNIVYFFENTDGERQKQSTGRLFYQVNKVVKHHCATLHVYLTVNKNQEIRKCSIELSIFWKPVSWMSFISSRENLRWKKVTRGRSRMSIFCGDFVAWRCAAFRSCAP